MLPKILIRLGTLFRLILVCHSASAQVRQAWLARYTEPGEDYVNALVVDSAGNVYVTGQSSGGDYATIKYITSQLSIGPLLPGAPDANLSLLAAPNSSWTIQRALQLPGAWTNVGTVVTDTIGFGLFQDAPRPAGGAFYRARQP